jgi:SHS2 domain-containing protein
MTATATPVRVTRNFGYFELDDQLGVTGCGATVEQAFESVAQGVCALMAEADTSKTAAERMSIVDFTEPDLDRALVKWVDRVLQVARTERLHLMRFKLGRIGDYWSAEVWGAAPEDKQPRTRSVKAADPSFAEVTFADGIWQARCLVDW